MSLTRVKQGKGSSTAGCRHAMPLWEGQLGCRAGCRCRCRYSRTVSYVSLVVKAETGHESSRCLQGKKKAAPLTVTRASRCRQGKRGRRNTKRLGALG